MQTSNFALFTAPALKKSLLLAALGALFSACNKYRINEVKATVICLTPISETAGANLPESWWPLLYPAGGCDDVYYRILPSFIRFDDPDALFEPKLDASTFSGNKHNPHFVERVLNQKVLPEIKVGAAFAAPYDPAFDRHSALRYELEKRETENYYLFFANDGRRNASFSIYPVYTDADSLRARIGDYYCEHREGGRPLVIVLNPPLEEDQVMPAPDFINNNDSAKEQPSGKPDEHAQWMSDLLNRIGNADRLSSERQAEISRYLDRFAAGTDVKIYGANGTLTKMTPIEAYLQQISYYKTLRSIEVQEVMVRDDKIWEVRLVEHHQ